MAANISHTDVICLDGSQEYNVPSCPHGPTLLFERYNKSAGEVEKFFACSAFRDRKACNFFRRADSVKDDSDKCHTKDFKLSETHEEQRQRYFAFEKLPVNERHVCCSCGLLLLPGELSKHGADGHIIKNNVQLKALQQPSYLFIPRENNKTYAQYLFARKTVNFILGALSKRFSHFLCIGTPRIHELIQSSTVETKSNLSSFLLDLDQRYLQLYSSEQFAQYNMFNNHFFESEGQANLLKFLGSANKNCVFLVDPPFGGMVEPLALSLSKLSDMCLKGNRDSESSLASVSDKKSCDVPFLLFFPYFMEKRILSSMNGVTMLDYKVEYDNHALYKNDAKKKGSPVRMFAHESLTSLELPSEDGYWWCKDCQKYSASENWHCKDCGACTSKDGTKYVHCDMCLRCVKPSRKHCFTCGMCQTHDHTCNSVKAAGCYICGEMDHKKRECPQKTKPTTTKRPTKRKGERKQNDMKKKKV